MSPESSGSQDKIPKPNLLDVVKINGRWAQVVADGRRVNYLSDGTGEDIDWSKFKMTKSWHGLPVYHVGRESNFTEEEIDHIHWGPEEKDNPRLKTVVSVFGEFESIGSET